LFYLLFFFNDTATTEIYTLSLHDALPIYQSAFGVVAGDLAGFPNGRRPGDDVVDIALRVVMGALCHPVDLDGDGTATDDLGLCSPSDAPVGDQPFSDLAPIDATYVDSTFPYLKAPLAGSVNP